MTSAVADKCSPITRIGSAASSLARGQIIKESLHVDWRWHPSECRVVHADDEHRQSADTPACYPAHSEYRLTPQTSAEGKHIVMRRDKLDRRMQSKIHCLMSRSKLRSYSDGSSHPSFINTDQIFPPVSDGYVSFQMYNR